MRNIDDIIKELEEHPDLLSLEIWTKDHIHDEIIHELYHTPEHILGDDVGPEDVVKFENILSDIDLDKLITEKDYKKFEKNIRYYNDRLYDMYANHGDYNDRPEAFENWTDELKKRIKREILLSLYLNENK